MNQNLTRGSSIPSSKKKMNTTKATQANKNKQTSNPKTSSSNSQSSSKPESESINIQKPQVEPHNKTPRENGPISDSPTKSKLASFDDSLDDFASPIVLRKRNIIPQLKVNAKPKPKTTSKRTNHNKRKATKNYTIKIIEENFNLDGANPDHLQLAIALSKSTYEAERGQSSECKEESPDVGEILQNAKPTSLERFGFKANKAPLPVVKRNVRTGLSELSKRAKSRFKYITPILKIRSTEERESLISSKILQILGQSSIKSKVRSQNSVVSPKLQDFIPKKVHSIFQTDEIYTNKYFYTDALKLPKSSHKCRGCLLKDFDSILGRDKSPTRETDTHNKTTLDNVDTKIEDSIAHQTPHIKIVSDVCIVKPSTSFSFHTNHERMSKSWTSDTKDSGITGWSRDTFSSVSSSYRGVSPDLFGSDEEECYSNRTVEFGSANPNMLDLETSTLVFTVSVKESDDKPNSSKIEMDPNNSDREDVVDLTDDDIEPQNKNHSSSLTRLASFYSLDEFEDDLNSDSAKELNVDEEDLILNSEVAEIIEPSVNKDNDDVPCASLREIVIPDANSIRSAIVNRSSCEESKKITYKNREKFDKKKSPGHGRWSSLQQSPKKGPLCKTPSDLTAEKNPTMVTMDSNEILHDSLVDQHVRHENTSRPSTSSNQSQHTENSQKGCLNSPGSKGFDLIQQNTNTIQRKIYPSQSPSNRSTVDQASPNYSKGFEDWEPEDHHFDEIGIPSPAFSSSFALDNSVNHTDLADLDQESSLGSPRSLEEQRSDDFKSHILKEKFSVKNEISCIEILDDSLLDYKYKHENITSRPTSRSSNRSEHNNQDFSLSKSDSITSDFDLFKNSTDNDKIKNSDSHSSIHHRSPNCTEVFDDWVPEHHDFEDIDVLSPSNGSIEHTDSERNRTDMQSSEHYNQKTNLESAKLENGISSEDRITHSHSNSLSKNHRSPNCSEVYDDFYSEDHHLEDIDAPSPGMTSSFTHTDPDKNRTKCAEHSDKKTNIDSPEMGRSTASKVPRIDDPLKSPLLKVNTSYNNADDCIELSDDSLTDHHFETLPTESPAFDENFEEKSTKHCAKGHSRSIIKENADSNIELTPKRSLGCISSPSIKIKKREELLDAAGYVGMSTNRLSSFGISRGYNSTDLNVTDYVHDLLNREQFSFDHCDEEEANEDMALSQESRSSVLADDELNYSSHFATPGTRKTENRIIPDSGDVLIVEDFNDGLDGLSDDKKNSPPHTNASPLKQPAGTVEPTIAASKFLSTPDNYVIKTQNITPMPNYDDMTTPLVNKELQKLGVKPLKRARGATLLKYIYESTHPLAGSVDVAHQQAPDPDEDARVIKRRKWSKEHSSSSSVTKVAYVDQSASSIDIVGDRLMENEKPEDLLFERRQSVKIPSCQVPLQIIWHNFLSCNPTIRENILLYEPLQLESLHKMLKELGYKFHVQDLLTYLDKKCITIRTAQKQGKRHR